MRRESKCHATKKSNTKEGSNGGPKEQKKDMTYIK